MQFKTVFSIINPMIIILLVSVRLWGYQEVDYGKVLHGLEQQVQQGQKRGLRDLATFLDHPSIQQEVHQLLLHYTLFRPEEIDLTRRVSKQQFLDFYYANESRVQYSDIFDAFHLTPIEQWSIDGLSIKNIEEEESDKSEQLRLLVNQLEDELPKGHVRKCKLLIAKIAQLDLPEGYQELLRFFEADMPLEDLQEAKQKIDLMLCRILSNYPQPEVMSALLYKAEEGSIPKTVINQSLNKITNLDFTTGNDYMAFMDRMQYLLDSIGSLEGIRMLGYESYFPFNVAFFPEEVDYYGRILTSPQPELWTVHNTIKDLINTRHPRALFYLAAYYYKNRQRPGAPKSKVNKIYMDSLNAVVSNVLLLGSALPANFQDRSASHQQALNQLLYWSQKYKDYEWNDDQQCFVNKILLAEKTEKFERMFRRLASKNDTVAIESFVQLTEGKPREIFKLAEKYRQLFRSYNRSIPSLKYQYLEMLTLLTDFCKRNQFSYQLSERLRRPLDQLRDNLSPQQRYEVENGLIHSIRIEDITAVEYWATVNERNEEASFSVGRILDWVYSRHWGKIMNNNEQLRLFLKKSQLFSNYGVYGICNDYLNKFDPRQGASELQQRLQELLRTETDSDIKNQLEQLLAGYEEDDQQSIDFDLDYYLANPQEYSRDELELLPKLEDLNAIQQCINTIKLLEDVEDIKAIFAYLSTSPSVEMVPYLFELISDNRIILSNDEFDLRVRDRIIPIIEEIYEHNISSPDPAQAFATEAWVKIWKADGKNYKDWKKEFYAQKVKQFLAKAEIKIEEINEITESDDFSLSLVDDVLEALPRVKPKRNIRKISLPFKIAVEDYLPYFETLQFNYKDLDDVPKIFKVEAVDKMLAFFEAQCEAYDISEKGSFYNNILQKSWMETAIQKDLIPAAFAKRINDILNEYLDESDFISEFEERRTVLHMAQIESIGKSLEEKLIASFGMDAEANAKAQYQARLIDQISYDQIGVVLKYIDQLAVASGRNPYDFLSRNFGIPIFDLSDYKTQKSFLANYQKMTEIELYRHYLRQFGIDIWKRKGSKLNFEKVYEVLQFDIVSPFAGSGGSKRDWYSYGVIKVLEHQFNDRLGFSASLSEARSEYNYSNARRAEAWLQYLVKKGLVTPDASLSPSFNVAQLD